MESYSLDIIDVDTILHELFPEDEDSREQIIDEMTMADWRNGTRAYSLIHVDEFMEFLGDCVDNEICEALTHEKIKQIHRPFQIQNGKVVDMYINLEQR
jgi:hypothetical protein